jgi:hypothetical protein
MIKTQIVLYAVTLDKFAGEYKILSEDNQVLIGCSIDFDEDLDFIEQFAILFNEYFEFSIGDIRKINLDPFVENNILYLPIFCMIPYITSVKNGFLIPAKQNVQNIPSLRKILNLF